MLTLNGVTINLQLHGTIIGVFLTGTQRAIERQYFSFYNHETTGGELEWWSPTCGLFWIYSTERLPAMQKFMRGLQRAALAERLNAGGKDEATGEDEAMAQAIAEERCKAVETVTWWDGNIRPIVLHGFGDQISAEKGTGNFNDDVLSKAIQLDAPTMEAMHATLKESEPAPTTVINEEEDLSERLGQRLPHKEEKASNERIGRPSI